MKFKEKLIDIANLFLTVFLLSHTLPSVLPTFTRIQAPVNYESSESQWGRDRDFPDDFSSKEKILLTEQLHDFERTTLEMDNEYQNYLSLLKTERVISSKITLIKYKDDCFFRPIILQITPGQAITIINSSDEILNLGGAGDSWTINPQKDMKVIPKLEKAKGANLYYGYSCSEKGLAGYFVTKDQ